MASVRLRGQYPVRSTRLETYLFTQQFTVDGTSDPDGLDPTGTDIAVARTGVGDFTITFPGTKKPLAVHYASCVVIANDATHTAKCGAYVPSTGVLPVHLYEEDGTSGISASAETNADDMVLQVFAVCTRSSHS